jgi:hypothetical protein
MLFELRRYRTRPGLRDEWVRFMEETIIPFQVSKGMVIVGSFVAEEDPDVYVWIRRFADEADRERLYRDVYESEHWKSELAPRVTELIFRDQIAVTRLQPTALSVIH